MHPNGSCIAVDDEAEVKAAAHAASAAAAHDAQLSTTLPAAEEVHPTLKMQVLPAVPIIAGVCAAVVLVALVATVAVARRRKVQPGPEKRTVSPPWPRCPHTIFLMQ